MDKDECLFHHILRDGGTAVWLWNYSVMIIWCFNSNPSLHELILIKGEPDYYPTSKHHN